MSHQVQSRKSRVALFERLFVLACFPIVQRIRFRTLKVADHRYRYWQRVEVILHQGQLDEGVLVFGCGGLLDNSNLKSPEFIENFEMSRDWKLSGE